MSLSLIPKVFSQPLDSILCLLFSLRAVLIHLANKTETEARTVYEKAMLDLTWGSAFGLKIPEA